MIHLTLNGEEASLKEFVSAMEAIKEDTFERFEAALEAGGLDETTDEVRKVVTQTGLFNPWLMFIAGMELGRRYSAQLEIK